MRLRPANRTGWFIWGCLIGLLRGYALAAESDLSDSKHDGDELFSRQEIPHIQIEVSQQDYERLRSRGWSWGWAGGTGERKRPEVQAIVREGGRVYTNVACHLKGSAGSFQPVDAKPSFTLNFDKHVKGQTFHGLEKISLNNSVQDPSFLCEKTSRELFNAAGIPAPRADFATVQLNGRKLGFYVLVEGYNRQFLKRHFNKSKGYLYDGGFLRDIDSPLAANAADEAPEAAIALRAVVDAASEPEPTRRYQRLAQVVDMERFLTFLAMEVLTCHWDGYGMNKNNYRIYHDPETGRMVFLPHGMDQMFGVMMVQPSLDVRPPFQGLAAKALLETPEGRRRYFERLGQLNQSIFDVDAITNRLYQSAARMAPVLARISPTAAANHQREVEDLCDRIAQRKLSLDEQLAGAQGKVLVFNDAGNAELSDWRPLTNAGTPVVSQNPGPEGKPLLHIGATRGTSVASWRTKVLLEEGHYRFEGRMKTQNVSADRRDRRAGAGLRVSERSASHKVLGSSPWNDVAFEFIVPDGLHDVELVCELRAAQGEVWFDLESLRLVRK